MSVRYAALAGFLKAQAPGFAQSPEYLLHYGEADDLPGVVLAAYGGYLRRLAAEGQDATSAIAVLEDIAEWRDASIDQQLCDEAFEAIERDRNAEKALRDMMTGRLRDLHDKWKAAQ